MLLTVAHQFRRGFGDLGGASREGRSADDGRSNPGTRAVEYYTATKRNITQPQVTGIFRKLGPPTPAWLPPLHRSRLVPGGPQLLHLDRPPLLF